MSATDVLTQPATDAPLFGYLPPHSVEAEQSLLGALMLDNTVWDDVADRLSGLMFYRPEHRLVFEAMRQLSDQDSPMDVVTVSEALEANSQLERIGGLTFLAELARNTASTANAVVYAGIIRDRYQLRQLSHTCTEVNRQALNPEGRSASVIIQDAERELFRIVEDQPQEPSSVNAMLSRAVDVIDAACQSDGGITGVPTGFADLDAMTAGWQPADLIVVAGRPSQGKTSLGLNLIENALFSAAIAAQGPVFVFSQEMPEEQLMLRLLASVGRLSLQKLRTGKLEDEDWPKLTAAVARVKELEGRLFIDDESGISASTLKARARRLARRHGQPSLILIDYLQLLHEPGGENRNLEISAISRILKALAKDLRVPVIALSQLNRQLETRPNKRPCMADLRDSGAIEQDADVIAFVYRDEVYHPDNPDSQGLAELIIGKQRNGPIGTVNLMFLGDCTRFESLEWKHQEVTV
ncbi:replicative DNA helicase [Billgrantia montanilacus]|uniref:Replicative DNA helicase n=1 Tax=Billgrantia montanilacus TaxID=2282305 RepID=A0A368TQG0_9GAMM|nr:replicative DNA helicase [Halomonas montanilacus]RCV86884.1 replicative DNA helicase [Halomonas montanilacus]